MKHKIIHTENYLLIVDDSEIKEGDYCTTHLNVIDVGKIHNSYTIFNPKNKEHLEMLKSCKKIIAHLPLNNSPILEGVDLLPPLEQEDVKKLAWELFGNDYNARARYKDGYNKAKEKYKYTEEDLRKAFIEGTNYGSAYQSCIENEDWEAIEMDENDDTIKEIIQSLSKPKMPVGFECEVRPYTVGEMSKLPLGTRNEKIKTTTNPQGQTVWVGKYIY
jgi:hypothetical protein